MTETDRIHPTACIDEGAQIGEGTRVWHFSHVATGAQIGKHCSLGQNVYVANGVTIGNNVKIQNNVALYTGVELADDVFCGPSCVFTNVINPRAQIPRRHEFRTTRVHRGATLGANATILCGVTIGMYAFVAAGAVVTRDVPQYGLMLGVPAVQAGWMTRHGHRLPMDGTPNQMVCPESGWRYERSSEGRLVCLDYPEEKALPGGGDQGSEIEGQLLRRPDDQ